MRALAAASMWAAFSRGQTRCRQPGLTASATVQQRMHCVIARVAGSAGHPVSALAAMHLRARVKLLAFRAWLVAALWAIPVPAKVRLHTEQDLRRVRPLGWSLAALSICPRTFCFVRACIGVHFGSICVHEPGSRHGHRLLLHTAARLLSCFGACNASAACVSAIVCSL